jgi:hypothetical protein
MIIKIDAMKKYSAIIWLNADEPGIRETFIASSLNDARKQLEDRYGEGREYTLRSEKDAAKPR